MSATWDRTTRVLEEGMVLTVEPGIYFNDFQMDKGLANPLQAQFLVKERIDGLRTFGGARIEDMVRALPVSSLSKRLCLLKRAPVQVLVTATGIEQLTTVPRDIERVEAICQGGVYDHATGIVTPN